MKPDLITIARQQIFDEYIAKRKTEFDQWMIEADTAWKEERIKLPYPAFSVYPDSEEIYARVEILNKKFNESVEEVKENNEENIVETKLPILLQKRKDKL